MSSYADCVGCQHNARITADQERILTRMEANNHSRNAGPPHQRQAFWRRLNAELLDLSEQRDTVPHTGPHEPHCDD